MALLVQKFGGTSVGTTERIEAVADLIIRTLQSGHKVVAVVSAMAGETNRLLGLAQHIDPKANARELDVLAASGEQVTVALLALALVKRGYPAVSLLADQICIHTDNKFGKARIERVDTERLQTELEQGHIVVCAGFQGRDFEGNLTTLGRGGSDTSAVALAAALKADECQIYTDVDGVYTIDPRICAGARRLPYIPFADMLELASVGAKVLHARSVEYAGRYQVRLRVLSTFRPDAGTLMLYQHDNVQWPAISGIACQHAQCWLQLAGINTVLAAQLLALLAERNIDVDMLQQEEAELRLALGSADWSQLSDEVLQLLNHWPDVQLQVLPNVAKLSVVGCGISTEPQLAASIRQWLDTQNVPVWALMQSESRLSVLTSPELIESVAAKLHQVFCPGEN